MRPVIWPDLPHMPLLRTSVTSPTTGLPSGITVWPFSVTASATSSWTRWPTRSFLPSVVSGSAVLSEICVPARRTLPAGVARMVATGAAGAVETLVETWAWMDGAQAQAITPRTALEMDFIGTPQNDSAPPGAKACGGAIGRGSRQAVNI
ncbi:hypothetical protein DM806_20840 [Sphingobium lactosutens]|nr:hypothetical protein [Sphingobium lactosutens]